MLQRFYGYTKSADESIDKMSSALKQFSDEIYDLAPEARPSEISRAAVIMNACEGVLEFGTTQPYRLCI